MTREEKDKNKEKTEEAKEKDFLKMQLKKLATIFKSTSKKDSAFVGFLKTFATVQTIAFITGSMAFLFSGRTQYEDNYGRTTGGAINNPLNEIYGDNMSYSQAIKNAYLLDDWRNGNGGVFQGVCGLLSMVAALGLASSAGAGKAKSNFIKSRSIMLQLDELKQYGIDANQLIKDLDPGVKKLISKMSEKDRGYFDNLISGGLDNADYETCNAIVSGYLKSHPKEYNEIIKVIDTASLPEELKKKYGKMISFTAAQEMRPER